MTSHDDPNREPSLAELHAEVLALIDEVVDARLADGELARRRARIKIEARRAQPAGTPLNAGLLSPYPPSRRGPATFTAALAAELRGSGVVRLLAGDDVSGGLELGDGPDVVHTWHTDAPGGWAAAARALNRFEVAIVQHDYDIYPGDAGGEVLPLLRALRVPSIVVLHAVLSHPEPLQRSVLERLAETADALVTMTETARRRLVAGYAVDPRKVSVIPHGAGRHDRPPRTAHDRPHLLTWGLIEPGKGIEWALRALAEIGTDPAPIYTVAGAGDPAYRDSLRALAGELGVAENVRWLDTYLDTGELSKLIHSADVVVLPYDSTEQVTSGVLVEAVAAGLPVVATEFPHAIELLCDGAGLLVPHRNPESMAAAIRHVLVGPWPIVGLGPAGPTSGAGVTLRWPAVAARYRALAERLLSGRAPLDRATVSQRSGAGA